VTEFVRQGTESNCLVNLKDAEGMQQRNVFLNDESLKVGYP